MPAALLIFKIMFSDVISAATQLENAPLYFFLKRSESPPKGVIFLEISMTARSPVSKCKIRFLTAEY